MGANALITWKDFSVDVTANQLYSLSDQTKSIVKALDKDVTFYVINAESDVNGAYEQIFNEYKKLSSKIHIEYKDPELYPNFTKDYVDDSEEVSNDSVIVVCGDKNRMFPRMTLSATAMTAVIPIPQMNCRWKSCSRKPLIM